MYYKLKKPNISKIEEKNLIKTLFGNTKNKEIVFEFIKKTFEPEYIYWDIAQHKEPTPKDITKEELWKLVKIIRESQSIKSQIKNKDGQNFKWLKLPYLEEFFHELDMNTGGELFVDKNGVNKANKQKLITRGIMDEAIASSQLEGAATSRQAAKKMLREGRKPTNRSEQMIVNSYNSMKEIEENYKDKKMNMDLILELHALITKDTLDSQNEKPRMRKAPEPVFVTDTTRYLS